MTTWLVALGLVALPILIHLFNRTRYRRVQWAAMEFLLAAYRKTRRRVQVEHLLLLVMRVLAMLFLAFAFFPDAVSGAARSTLDALGISFVEGTNAGKARHLVIVLDDSFSMHYRDSTTGQNSFDRGREATSVLLARLRENRDQVTLIPVSGVTSAQTPASDIAANSEPDQNEINRLNREIQAVDVKRASERIGRLKPGYGSGNMLAALREAARRVNSTNVEQMIPEVAVISDMQANAWSFSKEGDPQFQAFTSLCREIDERVAQGGGSFNFTDVGPRTASNYAIVDIEPSSRVVGVGIPVLLQVKVGNFTSGVANSEPFRLQYRIDDGEAQFFGNQISDLQPGQTRVVEDTIGNFPSTGERIIRVEIASPDALESDNERSLAIRVINELSVLVVNGAPDDNPVKDEVSTLVRALGISAGDGPDAARVTPKSVEVKSLGDLMTVTALERYAVIFLCNVAVPPAEVVDRLEAYVRDTGGTVIVTLGDNVNVDATNNALWKGGRGLLPARLDALGGVISESSADARLYSIVTRDLEPGSPLEEFKDDDSITLIEKEQGIRTWMGVTLPQNLEKPEGDKQDEALLPPARVSLAVNADGAPPLLVDRAFGRGRVLLWTTSIDNAWQDYWSLYPPLPLYFFHDIVRKLAVSVGSPQLTVGEHFTRLLQEDEQTARGNDVQTPGNMTLKPIEIALANAVKRITFTQTAEPGIYKLRYLILNNEQEEVQRTEAFSVGIPGDESDVQRLGAPDTATRAEPMKVLEQALTGSRSVVLNAARDDEALAGPERGADRMDLWILFAGLAMLMLLGEMGVSVYFNRKVE